MAQPLQREFGGTTNSRTLQYCVLLSYTAAAWLSQNNRKSLDIRGTGQPLPERRSSAPVKQSQPPTAGWNDNGKSINNTIYTRESPKLLGAISCPRLLDTLVLRAKVQEDLRFENKQNQSSQIFNKHGITYANHPVLLPDGSTSEIADGSDFLHVVRQDCTILRPAMTAYWTILLQEDARFKYYQRELSGANNGQNRVRCAWFEEDRIDTSEKLGIPTVRRGSRNVSHTGLDYPGGNISL
ncbi:uncharacterized protein BDCG_04801 [Blastomyces dermatitidis ER-3]|uniref:Uncharacterized protein n=1 Tax=Ajellomyces dermatitidis (strain ER-3 / ATCC MYA-2586) TaxID=559297 RepID=A0ABP2F024_AJEDR|nr:uncharacterized protein BDCG_04801 [Blastomyces dermatitidis ER-3]EEQ89681.2 hypothetical protein BDCG_04801 [Blastomyces dermatitidis ER-3]